VQVVRAARKRAGLSDGFTASDPLFVELILDEGPIQDRRAMWPLAIIILAVVAATSSAAFKEADSS